ncbi:MAG: tetratricopeptide repeat protein [Candidatus Nucleicultricaceae bacterium]
MLTIEEADWPPEFIQEIKARVHQGYANAQCNLGWLYKHGFGVAQDYGKAFEWYKKAAEQGLTDAKNNLGAIYQKGLGMIKNLGKTSK